ncbi:MAG: glycosyltransferase family 2 protein [Duncaniella sp.]|uniref:glycosyltransferase family 2 protein n=1 Tax=Duncaniella sp. TaxID=2518496 RepID=UPI0023D0B712|nr:glycosyltransferase family A protein [Duncaniella sp.]MDE6089399.1 glycosyltransferase family 2 protein [Duncaniella sp.]
MKSPITIVIPAYNREAVIGRTLASIAVQTVMPARVVLVDNNSSDRTADLMREWAAEMKGCEVMVLTEHEPGACAARNRGLREVGTPFVMFFDSDDVMHPGHVADFTEAIEKHPGIDIFGRSIWLEDIDGSRRKLFYKASSPLFNHIFRASLSTQRMVVRTELVRRAGAWNVGLDGWNDYELGVRLLLLTDRIYELPGEPTVTTYRLAESITGLSMSANSSRWEKSLELIETCLRKAGMEKWVDMVDSRRMILAAQYRREADTARKLGREELADNALMQAARLRAEVLARTGSPMRMRMIYLHNRCLNRLTWMLVRVLFPMV